MILIENCTKIVIPYRKIPKISRGAYIFQRPFWRGLCMIGLACIGKEIYHFCFVVLCIREQIPCISPSGGLYLEGRFNGGFFALRFWGAYIWWSLYMEGLIFGILRYFPLDPKMRWNQSKLKEIQRSKVLTNFFVDLAARFDWTLSWRKASEVAFDS